MVEADIQFASLPGIDSWQIPFRCYKCGQSHLESVRNFMVGNVIFCPHCNKSTVVRDNVNFHLRSLLTQFYETWEKEQTAFKQQRERELAAFLDNRTRQAQVFESQQKRKLDSLQDQLRQLGESYDAPGKPVKKGSRFAWG
jgi:DNA-directed RNA polymerase subunit RPC12/RpoP